MLSFRALASARSAGRATPVLLAALLAGLLPAQFDVQSRLVLVPVTVTDSKGRPVDGLQAADFTVLDNGVPQKAVVDLSGTGIAPIAIVVAVQSSGISAPVLEKVQRVGAMIQPLITGERGCAAVVTFAEKIDWLQECTNNSDKIDQAFLRLQPEEHKSARLLDAVRESVHRLYKLPDRRRILLLISESKDRSSEAELDTVVMEAQSTGVTVYALTYSAFKTAFTTRKSNRDRPRETELPRDTRTEPLSPQGRIPIPPAEQRVDLLGGLGELSRLGKTDTTKVLADNTGGATYHFARQKALEDGIQKLGAELHSQYVLSFTPAAVEPGYHKLEVRLNRPGTSLRARPGYWSGTSPSR